MLIILAGLILFISEGVVNLKDIEDYPLLIVVGLTIVTLPITELYIQRSLNNTSHVRELTHSLIGYGTILIQVWAT